MKKVIIGIIGICMAWNISQGQTDETDINKTYQELIKYINQNNANLEGASMRVIQLNEEVQKWLDDIASTFEKQDKATKKLLKTKELIVVRYPNLQNQLNVFNMAYNSFKMQYDPTYKDFKEFGYIKQINQDIETFISLVKSTERGEEELSSCIQRLINNLAYLWNVEPE